MDSKSKEWEIWCRLDRFSRSRDRKEIQGLTVDEIKKTLARAQPSDRGKATAYIAGEEVIQQLEKEKEKKENKRFPWKITIGLICLILLAVFFYDKIDFEKSVRKALDRFGIVEWKDSPDKNQPILGALLQEYRQNIKILKDIAYDQQYVSGKMGAQLWGMDFDAYKTAASAGVITDVELATTLQDVYTKIFRIADNAMRETRTANPTAQISLYKLIAQNFKNNETLLEETLSRLEDLVMAKRV